MREWKKSFERNAASAIGLQARIEKVMDVSLARELDRLERRLGFLASVGSVAVYVGLFGTVVGIMTSFQAIAGSKSTNLAVVAPGIAEALLATGLGLSVWLLAFSMFFFLSLAFVKRYVELRSWSEQGREAERLDRRGYLVGDLPIVETMGLTSAYVSVLVLCLYVSSDAVSRLYRLPEALWLISLILLYWITRIWFLARRGQLPDDPVLFATRDRTSLVAGALIVAVGAVAAW